MSSNSGCRLGRLTHKARSTGTSSSAHVTCIAPRAAEPSTCRIAPRYGCSRLSSRASLSPRFVSLQLVMNIPYQTCQFMTYEAVKLVLGGETTGVEHGGAYNPVVNMAAGGVAGGTAAAFTTPLDVVKTRLQTQGATQQQYTGALDAIRTIHRTEVSGLESLPICRKALTPVGQGGAAFLRGLKPRVLFHVPSMAICWSTYESIKYFLTGS